MFWSLREAFLTKRINRNLTEQLNCKFNPTVKNADSRVRFQHFDERATTRARSEARNTGASRMCYFDFERVRRSERSRVSGEDVVALRR